MFQTGVSEIMHGSGADLAAENRNEMVGTDTQFIAELLQRKILRIKIVQIFFGAEYKIAVAGGLFFPDCVTELPDDFVGMLNDFSGRG